VAVLGQPCLQLLHPRRQLGVLRRQVGNLLPLASVLGGQDGNDVLVLHASTLHLLRKSG